MAKFIVISSAKGGTGKTTVAVNLATALHRFGRDVILIDANLTTPNIGLYLGAAVTPTSLQDVLNDKKRIEDTIYQHSTGLKVIPASISIENAGNANSANIRKIFDRLKDAAEVVIVDSPTGLGKETIDIISAADDIIVVTTPELPAVTDCLKTIKIAEKLGKNILGIVVNKITNDPDEMQISPIQSMLEHPVISAIPEDKMVKKSLQIKHPLVHSHPSSPASIEFKKLASNLIGSKYESPIKK